MTDLTARLDAIQARKDAASPAPWYCEGEPGDVKSVVHYVSTALGVVTGSYVVDFTERDEDAEFIAAAPTDIQDLLDLARKQQAAIDAVTARMENRAKTLRRTADRLMQQVLDRHPDRDHEAAIRYEHYALEAASGVAQLREALEAKP
jgi:hypothetical protein